MKIIIIDIIGYLLNKLHHIYISYLLKNIQSRLGRCGIDSKISYPFHILGAENLLLGDDVSIGPNCTIYCTRANCIFGNHTFTGPNLTIITGDHAYWPKTVMKHCYKKLLDDISAYDKPVVIEDDVWIGANVVILKGVTIGRGSIIAAGSIVVDDVKPYSIVAGNKAKWIKYKWPEETIKMHDAFIYDGHSQISE